MARSCVRARVLCRVVESTVNFGNALVNVADGASPPHPRFFLHLEPAGRSLDITLDVAASAALAPAHQVNRVDYQIAVLCRSRASKRSSNHNR
jgi:hypothetical protein